MTDYPPVGSLVVHDDSSPDGMPGKKFHDERVGQVLEHREGGWPMSDGVCPDTVKVRVLNPHPSTPLINTDVFEPFWSLDRISVVTLPLPIPASGGSA